MRKKKAFPLNGERLVNFLEDSFMISSLFNLTGLTLKA